MRLLLAEDDRAVLSILARGLEEEGYVLDSVERGDDALHLLRLYDYSAAILDWRMPGLAGDEVGSNTIDVHVGHLRKKLADSAAAVSLVTVRGAGHRLVKA